MQLSIALQSYQQFIHTLVERTISMTARRILQGMGRVDEVPEIDYKVIELCFLLQTQTPIT